MNLVAQTLQSAVSPVLSILRSRATAEDGRSSTAEGGRVFNAQAPSITDVPGGLNAVAQTNAQPTESRRYRRLKTCAAKAWFTAIAYGRIAVR